MLTTPSATLSPGSETNAQHAVKSRTGNCPIAVIFITGWGDPDLFAPTFETFRAEGVICKTITLSPEMPPSALVSQIRNQTADLTDMRVGFAGLGWGDTLLSAIIPDLELNLHPSAIFRLGPAPLPRWERILGLAMLYHERFRLGSDVPSRALAAYAQQTYGFAPSIGQALELLKLAKSNSNPISSRYADFSNRDGNALNQYLNGPLFRIWLDQLVETPFPDPAKPV